MKRLSELLRNGVADIQYYMQLNKGGGKGSVVPPPTVAPTPAVEEASVEIEDEDKKKKLETGKKELKIPLSTAESTGLNTGSQTQAKSQTGSSSLKM